MGETWFPAITTTGLFAAVLWLSRQLIAARLSKSVQFEFDAKIEVVRHEIREKEESLKAELRVKENEIAALRDGALAALSNRKAALDRRRLEAVDQLWESFNALTPARTIAEFMSVPAFAAITPMRVNTDSSVRDLLQVLGARFDMGSLGQGGANSARPFVDPIVWAMYSTIRAVILDSVLHWSFLKDGKESDFIDHGLVKTMLMSALPLREEDIKNMSPPLYPTLLDALEDRLLEEIRLMLRGVESDRETLDQAQAIIRGVRDFERDKERILGGHAPHFA